MKSKLFSLLYLFILGFLFISCEESNSIEYESDDILKKNNITDVVDLFSRQRLVDDNSMYLYTGIRKQHEWFALFDARTGMLLKEWYGRERNYIKRDVYSLGSEFFFNKVNDAEFVFSNYYINENYEWTRQLIFLKNDDVYYGSKVNDYATLEYLVPDRFMNHDYSTSYCYIQDFKGNIIADSLTLGFEYDNKTWFLGLENDSVHLLVHENDTLLEYAFKGDIGRSRSFYRGNAIYTNYRIESFNSIGWIEKTNLGYVIFPKYNTDNEILATIADDAFILSADSLRFLRLNNSTSGFEYDNKKWYIGTENDSVHLLVLGHDTLQKYTFKGDMEWNRSIHLGYGKYETYRIESFNCIKRIEKTNLGYVIIPAYNTDYEQRVIIEDAFILTSDSLRFFRLNNLDSFSDAKENVFPWFDGSILLYKQYVISSDLEIAAKGSYIGRPGIPINLREPVSYSDWVAIQGGVWISIARCNNKGEELWNLNLNQFDQYWDGFHEPQYTFRLENKNGNLYTFTCDILTYDGNRYKETFTVNVDTGELI